MLPKTLGGRERLVLLFDALDRDDRTLRWGAVWAGPDHTEPAPPEAVLDLAWDDFLLIAKVRRGIDNLLPPELVTAYQVLEPYGYIPEVFLAEMCKRLAEPVFFLPFALFMLVTGWRYRVRRRQRYVAVPMLALMPAVFYVIMEMCRSLINTLSIWIALHLDFAAAMTALAFSALALFILALFVLAGQQG